MEAESALFGLLTPQNLIGLGLILFAVYMLWNKLTTERTIGSDFKELIENLQNQLTDLKEDLKTEREYRQKAEQDKTEALNQVSSLTLEVQSLRMQVSQLQASIDDLQVRERGLIDKLLNKP